LVYIKVNGLQAFTVVLFTQYSKPITNQSNTKTMKITYKIKLLATVFITLALLVNACKKDARTQSIDGAKTTTTEPRNATSAVTTWLTTSNQSSLLAQGSVNFAADAGTNPNTITVDEGTTYQGIDGFGYTLTGGSASLLNGLGRQPGQRAQRVVWNR
jgi:glucosylceramidase